MGVALDGSRTRTPWLIIEYLDTGRSAPTLQESQLLKALSAKPEQRNSDMAKKVRRQPLRATSGRNRATELASVGAKSSTRRSTVPSGRTTRTGDCCA